MVDLVPSHQQRIGPTPEPQKIGRGIGGSSIAAVLGLDPYRSPLAVWEEETGRREPFAGDEFTEWGLTVEPALLAWYQRRHLDEGSILFRPAESFYHARLSWARATPDALVLVADKWSHGVQAKNSSYWASKRWDSGPPDPVVLQVQWEMFVTELPRVDVIAALGGMPPQVWTVWRDPSLIEDMERAATRFWGFVETDQPPPVDDSAEWSAFFAKRLAGISGVIVPADDEGNLLAEELRSTRTALRALERRRTELENQIKQRLANAQADAIETTEGLITWRERQGAVSWKTVAERLAERAGMVAAELAAEVESTRGEACRAFNVPKSWDREH